MDVRWIDKNDVVNSQLKTAIQLFFEQRDLVAIHTLVASAHQILFDLGKGIGVESSVKTLQR